jgi:hypothetical protein
MNGDRLIDDFGADQPYSTERAFLVSTDQA